MKTYDMQQRSPEWLQIKKGKLGASNAQAISAQGKGLETLILETMAEYYSTAERESYSNEHTERGNELESQARAIYELETGLQVTEIGWAEYNDYIGCSPDGLVNDTGLVEIKCPADKGFFKYMYDGKIDSGYWWQMQMQMLVCNRAWCDYVVYNPNFDQSIIIVRVYPDAEAWAKLNEGFVIAENKIKEIKSKIEGKV